MPSPGTCDIIYLQDITDTPAGVTICKVELYKNGVATGFFVKVTSGAATGNIISDHVSGSVFYVAGDILTYGISSDNPASFIKMNITMRCK